MIKEYLPAIIQCIVPAIALVYSICLNNKLNKNNIKLEKINRFIYIIKSDFDKYIFNIEIEYSKVQSNTKYINTSKYNIFYHSIFEIKILYIKNIDKLINSIIKFKSDINESYNIYYNN